MGNYYCQIACGEEDFSIDEWNKAYNEVKDLGEEIIKMVLNPNPCWKEGKDQCFACMALVGEQRLKNSQLTGHPDEDSPQRKWYLEWKAKGKPPIK